MPGMDDPMTWNPVWFRDGDGSVHLFVSIRPYRSPGNPDAYSPVPYMRVYEMHPLNADFTQWSAPVAVELPSTNTNEFWCWKEGDTYHAVYVDFAYGSRQTHSTSQNLITGWIGQQRLPQNAEGGMMLRKPGGGYRFYLEAAAGYYFQDGNDALTQFSGTQSVTSTMLMRNGKMTAAPNVFTYAGWQAAHLASLPAEKQAPLADPDGDGRTNLMECALDSDPVTADATDGRAVAGVVSSGTANYLGITFRKMRQFAGVSYSAEVSPTLASWDSGADVVQQSATLMTDGSELVRARDSVALDGTAPRRFIRLNVTQTP
jgi:hypothetical protein